MYEGFKNLEELKQHLTETEDARIREKGRRFGVAVILLLCFGGATVLISMSSGWKIGAAVALLNFYWAIKLGKRS